MSNNKESGCLWRVNNVARLLGKTGQAVYKMVERSQIPYVRIGRLVYFQPTEIQKWLTNQTVGPIEVEVR